MALIAMAVYSTEENGKDDCLQKTIESLIDTVDFGRHSIGFSVNASTGRTHELLKRMQNWCRAKVVYNSTNIGTAEAINKIWRNHLAGVQTDASRVHKLKMDDDVVIHQTGWLDRLEEAIERDPEIGICGLKRKDCWEHPERTDFYKSELKMLPHAAGQSWIIGEKVNHVMGTCQLYNYRLLEKIGYMWQPSLYGFDDSLAAIRCHIAGFYSFFLSNIPIDHVDPGGTDYQKWKEKSSGEWLFGKNGQPSEYGKIVNAYKNGTKSIYYNPFEHTVAG